MSSPFLREAQAALRKWFGYPSFRPMQAEVIATVAAGRDAVVLLPTGGGKSICYQIPAIVLPGCGLVISPLISLMKDQVESLKANGVRAAFSNSTLSRTEQEAVERALFEGELDLLYVSPEKVLAPYFLDRLRSARINLCAIDEAHCISAWGHDFRPEYARLKELRRAFPEIPVLALTATADKTTRRDMARQLDLRDPAMFLGSFDRPNLFLQVRPGQRRRQQIEAFVAERAQQSGIIYCLSRNSTEQVAAALQDKGFAAEPYHAGMNDRHRHEVQERFSRDETPIICATVAFGMGIDKSNVRWIIHYNLPKNLESYYQEIGRAGRDGLRADTLLFYSFRDVAMRRKMIAPSEGDHAQVQMVKLERMQEYAESLTCRRRTLLAYFGQEHPGQCGFCDNCLHPPEFFDGTRQAQMALSAVYRLREREPARMVVNVLRGSGAQDLLERGYDKVKTYGAGRHTPFSTWQYYLRQLLNQGYLDIAYDQGMALRLTPASHRVLFEGEKVSLVKLETRKKLAEAERKQARNKKSRTEQAEEALFESLRELRTRLAREQGLPPYVVFSDATLRHMSAVKPRNLEQMRGISGVGEKKLARYGQLFLDAVRDYCDRHAPVDKESTLERTLALYEAGHSLPEIAEQRELRPDTVLQHLRRLRQQGKAIDFERMIAPEKVERVARLLPYMDDPGLKAIYEGLDEQLSYFDIKLALSVIDQRKELS